MKSTGSISIANPDTFENTEWVFQFDDDEPQVIATSTTSDQKEVTFTIKNNEQSRIYFYGKNGKRFKIFARKKKL